MHITTTVIICRLRNDVLVPLREAGHGHVERAAEHVAIEKPPAASGVQRAAVPVGHLVNLRGDLGAGHVVIQPRHECRESAVLAQQASLGQGKLAVCDHLVRAASRHAGRGRARAFRRRGRGLQRGGRAHRARPASRGAAVRACDRSLGVSEIPVPVCGGRTPLPQSRSVEGLQGCRQQLLAITSAERGASVVGICAGSRQLQISHRRSCCCISACFDTKRPACGRDTRGTARRDVTREEGGARVRVLVRHRPLGHSAAAHLFHPGTPKLRQEPLVVPVGHGEVVALGGARGR